MKIGRYPDLSLAEARKIAFAFRAEIAKGESPADKRQKNKLGTLSDLVEEFLDRHVSKNKSAQETERILRKELLIRLGRRDYRTIKRADIIKLVEDIADRGAPALARNALAAIRKLFNWAMSRDLLESSPCFGVKAPQKARQRDRCLTKDELASIWTGANTLGWPFNSIIKLLILSGQRRAQISELRWSWIDFDADIIVFPASTMKNARDHHLPISKAIRQLLMTLPHLASEDRVFPARSKKSMRGPSGFSKAKALLDQRSGVTSWVLHDFRRTVSTGMNAMGIADQTVERVLSHVTPGVRGIYNRHKYIDEMRDALERWNAHPSLQSKP